MSKRIWAPCAVVWMTVGFVSCGEEYKVNDWIDPAELIDEYGNVDEQPDSAQAPEQNMEDIVLSYTGILDDYSTEKISCEIQICCIDPTHFCVYFRLYDQAILVQEIESPIDFELMARTIETPVIMTDVNGDGTKDFILDYGISGQMSLGQCILWNAEKDQYEILEGYSELWSPHYDKRERIIWEMRHEEATLYIINQYEVVENRLELKAALIEDYGSGYLRYTEKRMVDGELVTVHENVKESEISLDEWYYH